MQGCQVGIASKALIFNRRVANGEVSMTEAEIKARIEVSWQDLLKDTTIEDDKVVMWNPSDFPSVRGALQQVNPAKDHRGPMSYPEDSGILVFDSAEPRDGRR